MLVVSHVCLNLHRIPPPLQKDNKCMFLVPCLCRPDTATFESAVKEEAEAPGYLGSTLAFMFETYATPRVTPAALGSPCIDRDYYKYVTTLSYVSRAAQ